jgi:ankyrin repeat protein
MESTGPTGHIGYCLPRTISALETAISNGNIDRVKELLIDVNEILTPDSDRAIHVASKCNNVEMINVLLEHGSDINAVNHWKTTPLMYASWYGHYDVVVFLLEHGADYRCKNYWGETAKDRTIENNHVKCVELLSLYEMTVTKKAN